MKGWTTPYSQRKRSIFVLHSIISCVIDLYANVKLGRPCIFFSLRGIVSRRLYELCNWISKVNRAWKHTVPRPFSAPLPPYPAAWVPAIGTLTVDEAARPGHQDLPCFAWLSGMQSERMPRNISSGPTSIIRMIESKPPTTAWSGAPATGMTPATAWTIGETSSMTSAASESRELDRSVVGGLG